MFLFIVLITTSISYYTCVQTTCFPSCFTHITLFTSYCNSLMYLLLSQFIYKKRKLIRLNNLLKIRFCVPNNSFQISYTCNILPLAVYESFTYSTSSPRFWFFFFHFLKYCCGYTEASYLQVLTKLSTFSNVYWPFEYHLWLTASSNSLPFLLFL